MCQKGAAPTCNVRFLYPGSIIHNLRTMRKNVYRLGISCSWTKKALRKVTNNTTKYQLDNTRDNAGAKDRVLDDFVFVILSYYLTN